MQGLVRVIDLAQQSAENLAWTHFNKDLGSGSRPAHARNPPSAPRR